MRSAWSILKEVNWKEIFEVCSIDNNGRIKIVIQRTLWYYSHIPHTVLNFVA